MSAFDDAAAPFPESRGRQTALLLRALLLMTASTGVVDAVSYLALGKVFVANMTGNVVFLGFALAGDKELSFAHSLVALATFLVGALIGGRLSVIVAAHRGRMLAAGTTATLALLTVAFIVALGVHPDLTDGARYGLIVPLALGMGIQNATTRRLAVAAVTTNVVTTTLTALAADSRLAGGPGAHAVRRILSVLALFAGALVGAVLVRQLDVRVALALAVAILAAVVTLAWQRARRTPAHDWAG